jgi:hypothetical protein
MRSQEIEIVKWTGICTPESKGYKYKKLQGCPLLMCEETQKRYVCKETKSVFKTHVALSSSLPKGIVEN